MKILPCHQGTREWHSARAKYPRTASKAPAVMGASKYLSRNDLLRQEATGVMPEVDEATQRLFDSGHAAEEAARKIVEGHLKGPLLPLTCITDDEYLLASFDGICEEKATGWECKLWNESLAAQVRVKELDPHYYWQLEQQILVGNLEKVIFTCSDGTPERSVHMAYKPVPGRAEALLAGWKQFDRDLANYQPAEVIPAAVAAPTMALPAVSIKVEGSVALISNLDIFGAGLKAFIAKIPEKPETDQEFADCKAACKSLQEAQDALDAAEAHAMGQVSSFDEMRRTKALYFDLARSTRLAVEKLVTARESAIKVEIVQKGRADFAAHIAGLNKRLGKPYMPAVPENFSGCIKNKRTIASLHDAVDTELARCKIEANAVADKIQINLATLTELASEHKFLFADAGQIVLKANDDLTVLVKSRIAEHQAAEQKRLDAEREKIRAEEQAKAEAKAKETAAAQGSDTARSEAVTSSSANQPATAAAPTKPAVKLTTKGPRPTDDDMIAVLALHYRVHESKVIEWLLAMDLDAAGERMAKEFAA